MTSPAMTELRVVMIHGGRNECTSSESIFCETGVTMGQLADALNDHFEIAHFRVSKRRR